ncbi:MAG TPA: dihydrodipicolinate synthase family protein [Candidatus Acidoferrum sp.]|jgi:4-hydroxy-2-oxoglutarate aldolase
MDLSGIYPALTTPYAADGSVSLSDLKHNIQRFNAINLAGYVVLGSTGESVLLSRAEMEKILATAKEFAAAGKILIAGTGAESTAETIDRTKRAAELGYHVALIKTPYYYKPSYKTEVLVAHYKKVADASPIPILLYSVPQFTGVTLEPPEIAEMAHHPNIIGIKDSSGHVQRIGDTVNAVPASFQVLTGGAAIVFPAIAVGARGAILALVNALPEKCVALYESVQRGSMSESRKLQSTLAKASKLIVTENGIAGIKFVMDQRGYRGGLPRLPLQPLADASKQRLSAFLAALEPIAARA